MNIHALSADERPCILFRVECRANTCFDSDGNLYARRTAHGGYPRWQDFDNHLSWVHKPTGLLSFFSTWRKAMRRRRQKLEADGQRDIVVIAVWAKDLIHVYSAENIASLLGYPDTESSYRKSISNYLDEYLVEGGITADEYRILAVFEGGGPERVVEFQGKFFKGLTTIPRDFFPGNRSNNALEDIEDEIYSRTGVRDYGKRDQLAKEILGLPETLFQSPPLSVQSTS